MANAIQRYRGDYLGPEFPKRRRIASDHLMWRAVDSLDLVRALRDPDAGRFAEAISRQPENAIEADAPLSEAPRLMDECNVRAPRRHRDRHARRLTWRPAHDQRRRTA